VPRWSNVTDNRVTKVGRVLRATHLDELPQFWAVLRGEMSFVGPRPERDYFVNHLSKLNPYYLDRHAVKPGITGWAQINFTYTSTEEDARTKLEYDLFYVRYGNMFLDLAIMLQTVRFIVALTSRRGLKDPPRNLSTSSEHKVVVDKVKTGSRKQVTS